jgi:hypothetical protein
MTYRQRPLGLFFLALMILMGLQVSLKKPLCIDSNIVYKIDRVDEQKTESVYSCSQFKKVSFSRFFYENLDGLQTRFKSLEGLFLSLNLRPKFVLVSDATLLHNEIQILPNGLRTGDEMPSPQTEKELFSLSLANQLNIKDRQFSETLADFFIGKSDMGYQNLLSQAWSEAYDQLGFYERRSVYKEIIQKIKQNNLLSSGTAIEKLKSLTSSNLFKDKFYRKLNDLGFLSDSELLLTKLDVVIESNPTESVVERLEALALQNPQLKVALKNDQGLFLLPSHIKISDAVAVQMKIDYRLVFNKANANESTLKHYASLSEKLVLVKCLEELETLNFAPLFTRGVAGFLLVNKNLSFIQFHLPSYQLKAEALHKISNYFDFVKFQKPEAAERLSLGWQQSTWQPERKAFKAVAVYDVIQYYRIN